MAYPPTYSAALPRLSEVPPASNGWIHESKFDGYRTQLLIDRRPNGRRARAFTRRGLDYADQCGSVLAAAQKLDCGDAVIDGEVILPDDLGASDFHGLRGAIKREGHRLVFIAFDLIHLDGEEPSVVAAPAPSTAVEAGVERAGALHHVRRSLRS